MIESNPGERLDRHRFAGACGGSSLPAFDAASSRRRTGSVSIAERICIHEASHAVAELACGLGVEQIVINRNGGHVSRCPDRDQIKSLAAFSDIPLFELVRTCATDFTAEELAFADKLHIKIYASIISALAGSTGERAFFPDMTPLPATSDVQQAVEFAKLIAIDLKAAMTLLAFARVDAAKILIAQKSSVVTIADALITQTVLDGAEIEAILSGRPIRRKQWTAAGAELFLTMTGGLKPLLVV